LIEPHRQRDPAAFRVDIEHFDTDDIAKLRDFAGVLDVSNVWQLPPVDYLQAR
jgi:hypothetical protein